MRLPSLIAWLVVSLLAACGGGAKPAPSAPEPVTEEEPDSSAEAPADEVEPTEEVGDCDSVCFDDCLSGGGDEDACMVDCC